MTPSPRSRRVLAAGLAGIASLAVLAAPAAAAPEPEKAGSAGVRLLGEQVLPKGLSVDGQAVGELSGLDYDRRTGRWYVIADDTEQGPARFFTGRIDLDEAGLHDVRLTGAKALRRTDGSEFPSLDSDDQEVADPESIRVSPLTGTLFWSSEGRRDVPEDGSGPARLTDPWVRQATPGGHHLRQLGLPDNLRMSADERGPRTNQVFEGLTFSADGRHVATSMEGPLYQDGEEASVDAGTVNRLTFLDALTGRPVRQLAYELSAVDGNGVSELLALDRHRYLVLERAYSPELGNTVKLFEIDVRGATDVLRRDSLAGGDYQPVRKKLVVDLGTLGLDKVDNVEAMAWGPKLPGGERSLVLCSDDNFNDSQITQVIALALRR